MKLFKLKKSCRSCKREFEKNELANSIELKTSNHDIGPEKRITLSRNYNACCKLVCEACFFKLTEEQELRLNGLVKCQYCDTIHKTGQRCSTCGAH